MLLKQLLHRGPGHIVTEPDNDAVSRLAMTPLREGGFIIGTCSGGRNNKYNADEQRHKHAGA